ncbi:MAG: hypothetical protein U0R51_04535 [Solirubrobacterales bacterium]
MRSEVHLRLIGAAAVVVVLAGCGSGEGATSTDAGTNAPPTSTTTSTASDPAPDAPTLRPPPCPDGAANCERASGQVAYVERVDADGDGDAHFVLVSDESITGPGISVIDVRVDLRPDPLPGPGDFVAASGPVYEGSYGQRQIQADAVRVRYAR